MPETATEMRQEPAPSMRARLRAIDRGQLDGRCSAAKRIVAFETQLTADLGGDLTEAQKALTRRAGVLDAVLSDHEAAWALDGSFDLASYVTGTNSLRRLLVTLGVHRVQRAAGVVELMSGD